MPTNILDLPPFPRMKWGDGDWEAEVVLPEWSGFQSRRGAYCGTSTTRPSDGSVFLRVLRPGGQPTPPSDEQTAAYQHLIAHGTEVRDAILKAVFDEYPTFREDHLDCFDAESSDFVAIAAGVPEIVRPDQLRSLMGVGNLFILNVARDGVAYVGFEFGCEWESEHGLGVMTHGTRVIEIGQAPEAFQSHAARADAARG